MPSQETASKSPKLWMLGYASFCVIGFFSPFWVANYQLRKQVRDLNGRLAAIPPPPPPSILPGRPLCASARPVPSFWTCRLS